MVIFFCVFYALLLLTNAFVVVYLGIGLDYFVLKCFSTNKQLRNCSR